jgi:hypothetical protein
MILNRIVKAISSQNWFTVIIEIIVVVVGIFIGLQVDDWSQIREERIDEQIFMQRLHEDILLAHKLSKRVRLRRLEKLDHLISSSDILYDRIQRKKFDEKECKGIGSSHHLNINVSRLASVTQLTNTGMLAIIRDPQMRTALAGLEQTIGNLNGLINLFSSGSVDLSSKYPNLIQVEAYYDLESKEMRLRAICNLEGMKQNQSFLNDASQNIDRYDSYIRDGVAPWDSQFDIVHNLVDIQLKIKH